jgi:DNA-binding MarR family transcriptional regulator/N-acetylglutamate synthase-like GNAT family acetyltransferase
MTVRVAEAEQFRDFNRFYTQTIGVLTDQYLGQHRPLAEARLLFEIGFDGADVRDLRTRLRLDSGYVSRLLRALEAANLVRTRPSPTDSRVRLAELTADGRSELEDLNNRATTVASALLDTLHAEKRSELLEAMMLIRRYLRLSAVESAIVDPGSRESRECLLKYASELALRFPEGYTEQDLLPAAEARAPAGAFIIARENGHAIGCGVLRTPPTDIAEIRHLWIAARARGIGLGRRLVSELELHAVSQGYRTIRLDTHSALSEAINLYRSSGYQEISAYDTNPHAHLWFEKSLQPEDPTRSS